MVVTIGVPGAGKSTFTTRWFTPTQRLNLDTFRGMAADDEHDQTATDVAVCVQDVLLRERCRRGLVTVVDSTNVRHSVRARLLQVAERVPSVAVVFDIPKEVCHRRNAARPQPVPAQVIERMHERMYDVTRNGLAPSGPVPGFTLTRRIGLGTDVLHGEVPAHLADAAWLLPA